MVHLVELLKRYDIPHRIAIVYIKYVSVGEKNTELYTINSQKDVFRMAGRGNVGLLTPELLKRKLITKETFSHALNPEAIACNVNGNRCFASKLYISADLEVPQLLLFFRIHTETFFFCFSVSLCEFCPPSDYPCGDKC